VIGNDTPIALCEMGLTISRGCIGWERPAELSSVTRGALEGSVASSTLLAAARLAAERTTAGRNGTRRQRLPSTAGSGSARRGDRRYPTRANAQQAVVEVEGLLFRGHPEVVDADLADYFGSIPHAELVKSVARRIVDRRMLHLIKMWLEYSAVPLS
jgi:hypothetical protein